MNIGSIISGLRRTGKLARFPMAGVLCTVVALASVPLTRSQRQRAQDLYPLFVAPCCWRQSVAVHESPEAMHVRSEIDDAVAADKSDDQIKDKLIHEYGHGVLMNPEGTRAIVVYMGPILASAVGLLGILKWLRRNVRAPVTEQPQP